MRDTKHEELGIAILHKLVGWLMVLGMLGVLVGSQIWVWVTYSATGWSLILFEGLWCVGSAVGGLVHTTVPL